MGGEEYGKKRFLFFVIFMVVGGRVWEIIRLN